MIANIFVNSFAKLQSNVSFNNNDNNVEDTREVETVQHRSIQQARKPRNTDRNFDNIRNIDI